MINNIPYIQKVKLFPLYAPWWYGECGIYTSVMLGKTLIEFTLTVFDPVIGAVPYAHSSTTTTKFSSRTYIIQMGRTNNKTMCLILSLHLLYFVLATFRFFKMPMLHGGMENVAYTPGLCWGKL